MRKDRLKSISASAAAIALAYHSYSDASYPLDSARFQSSDWNHFSGSGKAEIRIEPHSNFLRIHIDATEDTENVWWAVLNRSIQSDLDMSKLAQPEYELRVEAIVRPSHAPRRINLSFHTSRTTDYHLNLMEYDLPSRDHWKAISLTTDNFDVLPNDQVKVQLALMDWGIKSYHLDLKSLSVKVVEKSFAPPDIGGPLPYHPDLPELRDYPKPHIAAADTTFDRSYPKRNFNDWSSGSGTPILSVGSARFAILKWNLQVDKDAIVDGPGILELASLYREGTEKQSDDSGLIRVCEIIQAPSEWDEAAVTLSSFLEGNDIDEVVNPQMIIDQPVLPETNSLNRWVIPQPVLQRIISRESQGIALMPLGPIQTAFHSKECPNPQYRPKLYFRLK